ACPAGDLIRLVDDERSRADEAHLTAEHVPQLRELVQAALAQEVSDAGDARVAGLGLEQWAVYLVQVQHGVALRLGALVHRAELGDLERRATAAAPGLPVDGAAGALQPDRQGDRRQER